MGIKNAKKAEAQRKDEGCNHNHDTNSNSESRHLGGTDENVSFGTDNPNCVGRSGGPPECRNPGGILRQLIARTERLMALLRTELDQLEQEKLTLYKLMDSLPLEDK